LEKEITEVVIGCAMKVHRALGSGFLESVYQNALLLELRNAGFQAETQRRLQVKYEGIVVGDFIADIIVNDELILELKTASALGKADEQQLVNYLKATGIDVGLLLNFGTASLEFRRKVRALSSLPVNPVNPVNPV
jgi:GxxExxY protein